MPIPGRGPVSCCSPSLRYEGSDMVENGIQLNTIVYHGTLRSMNITNSLQRARKRAGLTLRQLAGRAETSHATLSAYEHQHKSPSLNTYLRLMEAAGYAVDVRLRKRIRRHNGVPRGEELAEVLHLAEQFPANPAGKLNYPALFNLYPKPGQRQ